MHDQTLHVLITFMSTMAATILLLSFFCLTSQLSHNYTRFFLQATPLTVAKQVM